MKRALVASCLALLPALGCLASPDAADSDPNAASAAAEALVHTSDLASVMPSHLAIMYAMSWFGIPASDPIGPGPDGTYYNYQIPGTCSAKGAPASCVNGQRDIASRYRPLAGIYSSSGRDAESRNRIRLMLSTVRRPCDGDVGARIDAFAIQLDGLQFSSLHTSSPSEKQEIPLQGLKHFLAEADAAKLPDVVVPSQDTTWYFNTGKCSSKSTCLSYLEKDTVDMLTLSVRSSAATKINGKPVLYFYIAGQLTPAEWASVFANARNTPIDGVKRDFYALASHQGGGGSPYFEAFDGLSPWIDTGLWDQTSGKTVRAHAQVYAAKNHADLYANVPAGKVVLGGVAPGFDDFTNGWSKCVTRQMPRPSEAHPRDPGVLDGTIDFLKTKGTKGVILQTWDDWTEGSFFEPSVSEGTAKLEQLQSRLGDLHGEAAVSPAALRARWHSYGQPRSCTGAQTPPTITLCGGAPPSCAAPKIAIPTPSESVGPAIDLEATAPACIARMNATIDGAQVIAPFDGTTMNRWIGVSMGAHRVVVNGWDASGRLYASPATSFTRTY